MDGFNGGWIQWWMDSIVDGFNGEWHLTSIPVNMPTAKLTCFVEAWIFFYINFFIYSRVNTVRGPLGHT